MIFRNMLFVTSVISLLGVATASAQDDIFYSGDYICNGAINFSDWHLKKTGKNKYDVTIFQGNRGRPNFVRYDLSGEVTGGQLRLFEGNKPFLEADAPMGQDIINVSTMDSAWHPFSSLNRCSKFAIGKTDSAKDRWQKALNILNIKTPTTAEAAELAYLHRTLPPIAMLPDLDQVNFETKFNTGYVPFWNSYYTTEKNLLKTTPITTKESRKSLITEMRNATQFDLSPEGTLVTNEVARKHAIEFLSIVTERLSSTDTPVKPLDFVGMERCQRYAMIQNPNAGSVGLIVGLPIDYWDRTTAENVISQSRQCSNTDGLTQTVVEIYPEIEQFRLTQATRIDEAFKGMNSSFKKIRQAQNACIATFKSASKSGLKNSQSFINECNTRARILVSEHETEIANKQIAKILKAPKTLNGLKDNNWFSLDASVEPGWEPSETIIESFELQTQEALKEALKIAVDEIDTTLAIDDIEQVEATNVIDICNEVIEQEEDLTPIHESCFQGLNSLEARREEAECQVMYRKAKIGKEFKDSIILEGNTLLPIRNLVCGAALEGKKISIAPKGFLFWQQNILTVSEAKEKSLEFYLRQTDKTNEWKAEPANSDTKTNYLSCLAKDQSCN